MTVLAVIPMMLNSAQASAEEWPFHMSGHWAESQIYPSHDRRACRPIQQLLVGKRCQFILSEINYTLHMVWAITGAVQVCLCVHVQESLQVAHPHLTCLFNGVIIGHLISPPCDVVILVKALINKSQKHNI